MKDAIDYIETLATRARLERAPRVNVSEKVLLRLSAAPVRRIDTQMGVLAVASAVMAAVTIGLSVWNRIAAPDPIETMIEVSSLLGL